MAELKTKKTQASVDAFIGRLNDEQTRVDCRALVEIMRHATKAEPKMWGSSIVGFGNHHYRYASGREGDWFLAGFSPRSQNLTIYLTSGFEEFDELLGSLGKHSTGKSCLYIKRLDDVHLPTLKKMIRLSVKHMVKAEAQGA